MTDLTARDAKYVSTLLAGIRTIRDFKPQLGRGQGVSLAQFQEFYGADPLYHWVGFDSDLMYAAHRAGGAMTSLYRHLGSGCEHLFREVISDHLGLTEAQMKWEYVVGAEDVEVFPGAPEPVVHGEAIEEVAGSAEDVDEPGNGEAKKGKKNSLDGRIDIADLVDPEKRARVEAWIERLRAGKAVEWSPLGTVFEVRQGYKSMDAKRQAADIANAAQALGRQRLPVLVLFSNQIDPTLAKRYLLSGWGLLRGVVGTNAGGDDPLASTYAFMDQVVGYDLTAFFERNTDKIRGEVQVILDSLLKTD
jgi:hypothetical protein